MPNPPSGQDALHPNCPKERFLKLKELQHRIPYSRASIYRLASLGKFPRPYPLGAGAVAWREIEIDAWIQERIASARATKVRDNSHHSDPPNL